MAVVATPERLALAEQVRELRDRGLTHARVAARLGISRSYAAQLDSDPDGSGAAARKDRYRLPCPRCGALMDGSNGISGAPDHCAQCARELSKVWTREAVIHALRKWYATHGRSPTSKDWRWADPDGAWPAATGIYTGRGQNPRVAGVFETWNDALRAAGLPLTREQHSWRRWTREDLVAEIAKRSADGKGPGSDDPEYYRLHTASITHFGSWEAACAAAGVVPRGRGWRSASCEAA